MKLMGYKDYASYALDDRMAEAEQRIAEDGHGVMLFYGVGNHGGGPTRWDIEYMQQNLGSTSIILNNIEK